MSTLEFKENIRTKTTYEIPILFGEPKYSNRFLFSHTVFGDKAGTEIRFKDQSVLSYKYDTDNFLYLLSRYNSNNVLEKSTKFELMEKTKKQIVFRDWTTEDGAGNYSNLEFIEDTGIWKLTFARVCSFLGYKITSEYFMNEMGDFKEERHYQYDSKKKLSTLKRIYVHEFEYKKTTLDEIHLFILDNGWQLPKTIKDYLISQNCLL